MIIRTPGRDRYVIISKVPLEDVRLSWKARGLLAYLLSKPDNWSVIVAHLVKQAPDGRAAVMAGLRELESAGYLVRIRTRDDEGRYDGTDSEIHEEPSDTSTVRFSDCGLSDCGKSHTNEERPLVKNEKDLLGAKAPRARDQLFDALVMVCQIDPTALTSSARGAANKAIKELREVGAEPEQVVQAASAYRLRYPGAAVTPSALAKHWPSLLEPSAPAQPTGPTCADCRGTGNVTEDNDERMVGPCWTCC